MVMQQETLDSLKSICGSVHITKGDCDEASSAPEDEVLAIGDLKVGVCHGHQVSHWHAEQRGADEGNCRSCGPPHGSESHEGTPGHACMRSPLA